MVQLWLNAKCKQGQGGHYAALKYWNNTSKNILQQPTLMSILAVHPPWHMKNQFDLWACVENLVHQDVKDEYKALEQGVPKSTMAHGLYTGTRPLDYVTGCITKSQKNPHQMSSISGNECLQFLTKNLPTTLPYDDMDVQFSNTCLYHSTRMTFQTSTHSR